MDEQAMYNMLMKLSDGLHELEAQGILLPPKVEQAWEQITAWLEAH